MQIVILKYWHLSEKNYLDDVISQVGMISIESQNKKKKQAWVYRSLVIFFSGLSRLMLTVSASGSIKDIEDSSPLSNTDTVFSSSPSGKEDDEIINITFVAGLCTDV